MQKAITHFPVGAFLVVFLAVVSCTTWADVCTDNGASDFCLDQPNLGQFPVGAVVIHANLIGTTLNVHVSSVNDPGISDIGIHAVGFNGIASSGTNLFTGSQPSGADSEWGTAGSDLLDGFGTFSSHTQSGGNNSNDLTWYLAGIPIYSGDPQFVVHLRYHCGDQTLSVFLSNLPREGVEPEPVDCNPANQAPVADAGPDQTVIVGESVTFNGTGSSDPDGTIASFDWDFGDAGTANGAILGHVYTTAGSFTATLTVTDDGEATATDTAVITVETAAQAIEQLSMMVASFNLAEGFSTSLDAKLMNAIDSLDAASTEDAKLLAADALRAASAGNRQDAANKLQAFINAVNAQRGKQITGAQADALIALVNRILAIL